MQSIATVRFTNDLIVPVSELNITKHHLFIATCDENVFLLVKHHEETIIEPWETSSATIWGWAAFGQHDPEAPEGTLLLCHESPHDAIRAIIETGYTVTVMDTNILNANLLRIVRGQEYTNKPDEMFTTDVPKHVHALTTEDASEQNAVGIKYIGLVDKNGDEEALVGSPTRKQGTVVTFNQSTKEK